MANIEGQRTEMEQLYLKYEDVIRTLIGATEGAHFPNNKRFREVYESDSAQDKDEYILALQAEIDHWKDMDEYKRRSKHKGESAT